MKKLIKYIFPKKSYYLSALLVSILLLLISIKIFLIPHNLIPLIFVLIIGLVISTMAIIKNPSIGVLITLAIMPFENIGGFYFHSIHIRFDQIIIGITAISFIISSLVKKDFKIKKDPTLLIVLALIIANILSLTNALNMTRDIEIFLFTLITYIIYYAIPLNFFDTKYIKYIPNILLTITILLSLFGLYQYFGNILNLPGSVLGLRAPYVKDVLGYPRIQATEVEPLYYGTYLIFTVTLSIGLLIFNKGKNILKENEILLAWGALILGGINLILTYARGAWIGEMFALLILFIIFLIEYKIKRNIIYMGVIAIVIVSIGTFGLYRIHKLPNFANKIIARATNLQSPDRTFLDNNALQAFANNPIVGIGTGGFGPYMAINPFITPPQNFGQIEGYGWAIVNNEYLEILTETGIVGFALFAFFFYTIFKNFIKAYRKKSTKNTFEKIILISTFAGLCGILLQYLTFSTLYILQIWMVIVLLEILSFKIIND
jgi:O-antigen ligase